MKTTALRDRHEKAGAVFVPYADYDLPLNFASGAIAEHRLTRRSVALFDISHMARFRVFGSSATKQLSFLVSSRVHDLELDHARYALLLDEAGTVRDDIFLYRLADNEWLMVANAVNHASDLAYLRDTLSPDTVVEDQTEKLFMLALQGPKAMYLLDSLTGGALSSLPRLASLELSLLGSKIRVARTGYTGEDGAELFFPASKAEALYDLIMKAAKDVNIEAGPAGLAARDSLRFEAGMPLYGHELGPTLTPVESGMLWACDFSKDFVGKEAVLARKAAGTAQKLVALKVLGGVPREGYPVLAANGQALGACVSGLFCPTLGGFYANAFVPPAYAVLGGSLSVLIRGIAKEAVVVSRPLYKPVYRR